MPGSGSGEAETQTLRTPDRAGLLWRLQDRLFDLVDASSLAVFRIGDSHLQFVIPQSQGKNIVLARVFFPNHPCEGATLSRIYFKACKGAVGDIELPGEGVV